MLIALYLVIGNILNNMKLYKINYQLLKSVVDEKPEDCHLELRHTKRYIAILTINKDGNCIRDSILWHIEDEKNI